MPKADGTKQDFEDRGDDLRAALEQVESAQAERDAENETKRAAREAKASGAGDPVEGDKPEGDAPLEPPADGGKPADAGKPADKPEGAVEGEKTPEAAAAPDAVKNWKKADIETFKELPAKGQEFLVRRHNEMMADYQKKTAAVADLQRDFGPIQELFSPYQQQIRASGQSPYTMVQAWMNVEAALMDPARATQTLQRIAQSYNINLGTGGSQQKPEAPVADPEKAELDAILQPYLAPHLAKIADLEARLGQVDTFRTESMKARQDAAINQVNTEIDTFANATNAKGELAHPYFNDVQDDMARLMNGYRAANQQPPSLEEVYQMAVRANPSTFARIEAAQRNAAENSARAEARAKAERARKAGGSIITAARGAQQVTNGKDQTSSIRSSLDAAFEEVASR